MATVGSIFSQTVDGVKRADMFIADITQLNSNVFFELGIAFGLNKQLLIVSQEGTELPFDITAAFRVVFYRPEDTEKLEYYMRYWVKESVAQRRTNP